MNKPLMIDAAWNRRHHACYDDARLAALYDRPMTPLEVMTRKDGGWIYVTDADRVWVGYQAGVMTRPHLRECLARMLERLEASGRLTDPRSLAVIPALRSDRVKAEVIAAAARAASASAPAAAYSAAAAFPAAAYSAAAAFPAAAYSAAAAAARAAERKHQVADIIEMLRLEERP